MTAMNREPECVALKRRGAEYVAKMLVGMSLQEQLEFFCSYSVIASFETRSTYLTSKPLTALKKAGNLSARGVFLKLFGG